MCKAGIRFESAGPIWLLRPRRAERCYWESGELGISTVELARRLLQAQATASQSVERGGESVGEEQLLMGCRLDKTMCVKSALMVFSDRLKLNWGLC
jgi:hypothetical protein